ncbi:MAG TPA: class I SAM-dependent methyltransferase [Nitrospira sp.]|nr:class I SAM-dependent methyltransferase [Nitrospira sp.]
MQAVLKALLPARMHRFLKRLFRQTVCHDRSQIPVQDYEVLRGAVLREPNHGWQVPDVARRQLAAFAPILQQMREGKPREDLAALGEAVHLTHMDNPLVVEVGCGSAWNREVLGRLSNATVRYVGLDYGIEMLKTARAIYPGVVTLLGDAAELPFRTGSIDILVSGTLLMHLMSYRKAIEESRRVSRRWCIFHTVPLLEARETTVLRKDAYGQPTLEIIFNNAELQAIFAANGLKVRAAIDSLPYDLQPVLGEPTVTKTFLCEVAER